ncbi:endonuclease/exonuclease/phosphatase family protein [Thalassococcus sp. S3]|uniref:endonuclease/exonuclease/phosphatase family protein n=1 Tax=Thalassococcus sp. S3 TaxID=2017482 RepID=UPI001024546B|nr:endonuclease/exonuclease/phosphatase family protein [Thalassococcus sp. S3]QBF33192.1 endonuclease [Thalassococcus sp. S3]
MTRRARQIAILFAFCLYGAVAHAADTVRIATWNVELQRSGPGLLLRDIMRGQDQDLKAVYDTLLAVRPDIVALQGFDHDQDGVALRAFADALSDLGLTYDHLLWRPTNRGRSTGLDMDGNGRMGEARDAQGYGRFSGQGAMAVLSRYPIRSDEIQDFTDLLWRDLPGALLPRHEDGTAFPSPEAQAIQRLSSSGHWVVPFQLPNGTDLHLLTFHATPPVFDGPEDLNGRRNHDEIRFWTLYLDGAFGPPPEQSFVIAGSANLDPGRSDGRREAIKDLIADPRVQDPAPQGAPNGGLATVDWPDPGPGRLRVDYVLPSRDLRLSGSGVYWPEDDAAGAGASRHRMVWVDIDLTN